MGVQFTGDWDRLQKTLDGVARHYKSKQAKALGKSLRKIEKTVLSHLDKQDLDWDPLTEKYAERKENKGLSPDTLRASNQMYQNITVDQPSAWTGAVGVQRGVKSEDGEDITDIALIHEQPDDDGEKIPARKLWKPTFEELKDEIAGDLIGTAISVFKK